MNKSPNIPVIKPTEIDYAKLAAYIDGEGSIRVHLRKYKRKTGRTTHQMYVEVNLSNSDYRLLVWAKERFGGCISKDKRGCKTRRAVHKGFNWSVTCGVAHEILLRCLPHFVIKREQAELAIAFRRLGVERWGVRGTPQEVVDGRMELRTQLQQAKTQFYEKVEDRVH